MLEGLFGSTSIVNVLLYIMVNGRGYGAQIKRSLGCPLTPLQKALDRLENRGVLVSYYEGKTRLYQFNPSYPLTEELKQLLNRAYSQLCGEEKRKFCYIPPVLGNAQDGGKLLYAVWKALSEVKTLTFIAKSDAYSKTEVGWNGQGRGTVVSTKEQDNVLIFYEKGSWKDRKGNVTDFSNVFRWSFDRLTQVLALEHLRLGHDRPVFLFHLAPSGKQSLSSIDSHMCSEDAYFGQLVCNQHGLRLSLRLTWRVIGPKKNEEIQTYYS
jgi:hypothetical protein